MFWSLYYFRVRPTLDYFRPSPLDTSDLNMIFIYIFGHIKQKIVVVSLIFIIIMGMAKDNDF
jgi:hypothetical protein